jgi:3-hydroxyacyl-[acyl-carrier-protein] dehydratase
VPDPRYSSRPEAPLRFILIDRLVELEPGQRAVASTTFPASLPLFADHFPGRPIVPGVLITEAMAQTAGWLIAATVGFNQWPLLALIEHAKFSRPVEPDEELRLTADLVSGQTHTFVVDVAATRGDERIARARLVFRGFDVSLSAAGRQPFEEWAQRTFAALGGTSLLRPANPP